MSARAIYKARIELDDRIVPVRFYAAAEDRTVHFRLLHADDHTPIVQRLVNPDTDEEISRDEVQRGLDVGTGVLVRVSDDELAELDPRSSRAIEVLAFVEPRAVPLPRLARPYWLGPDGDDAGYAALAAAIEKSGRYGVIRWTMRRRRYFGVLTAEDGALLVETLRPEGEVIEASELFAESGGTKESRAIDPKERKLATQLVAALEGDLDLQSFADEHRTRVEELIAEKARGKAPAKRRPKPAPRKTGSLAKALEASLKERKVA